MKKIVCLSSLFFMVNSFAECNKEIIGVTYQANVSPGFECITKINGAPYPDVRKRESVGINVWWYEGDHPVHVWEQYCGTGDTCRVETFCRKKGEDEYTWSNYAVIKYCRGVIDYNIVGPTTRRDSQYNADYQHIFFTY